MFADELIEKTSSMFDEIESKTVQKTKKVINREKRSKALSEVKLVKKKKKRICRVF